MKYMKYCLALVLVLVATTAQGWATCRYQLQWAQSVGQDVFLRPAGTTGTLSISPAVSGTPCGAWTVSSDVPWISLNRSSGNGNAEVSVTVQPTTEPRTGTFRFQGQPVYVTQAGSISSGQSKTGTFPSLLNGHVYYEFSATAGDTIIATSEPGSGWVWDSRIQLWPLSPAGPGSIHPARVETTGNYYLDVWVVRNPIYVDLFLVGSGGRGQSIACLETVSNQLSHSTQIRAYSFNAQAGERVAISTNSSSNSGPYLFLVSPSGSGGGPDAFSSLPVSGTYSVIVYGGGTFSGDYQLTLRKRISSSFMVQLSPSSLQIAPSGGTGTIEITAASGCPWTATVNDAPWITITSGGSGTGNGTLSYSVAANTGTSLRSGTITIGDQTFFISQAGQTTACPSISPSSESFSAAGGWPRSTSTPTRGPRTSAPARG